MTTLTFKGNQLGEALQFDGNGNTVAIEIGKVWFSATDTVQLSFAPGSFDATGMLIGGAGTITGLTVTTATGLTTTFGASPANPLDVDPDQSKNGGDFFYISESPQPGVGGAYAGLQLEKIVVVDGALSPMTSPLFSLTGGFVAGGSTPVTPPTQEPVPDADGRLPLLGTGDNDTLTGTRAAEAVSAGSGNDSVRAGGGNDLVRGGAGNDILDGQGGADRLEGGDGNDVLWGGSGKDYLLGGNGNDILFGGAGGDRLNGGRGGDTFVFGAGDRVEDFRPWEGDEIHFDAALGLTAADITITRVAAGTRIEAEGVAGSMLLQGYSGTIDIGNDLKFDFVPVFDFI